MSVIAMTMDDQRPLVVNAYDKMQDQPKYEQNSSVVAGGSVDLMSSNAPPSGPASPTPSGSEEPMPQQQQQQQQQQHHYHHMPQYQHHHQQQHHYHHQQQQHHHHHHHHQVKQQQSSYQHHFNHNHRFQPQQQQQQQQLLSSSSSTITTSHRGIVENNNAAVVEQKHQTPLASTSHQLLKKVDLNVASSSASSSLTCAVTVKAESVVDDNHGQQLLEEETIESLKLEQSRLLQQCADSQRREKILMRRLANKEQEFQDYVSQISEYKAAQAPSAMALRSALLDPAVNLLFVKLKKELKTTKAKLEETQNELSAWKFTPDSNTGKRLMAKCRLLYQENEELGKMTSNGRLSKLETDLAMQKNFSKSLIKSQSELDEFLHELDEDVEGMQSTILLLQQELKTKNEVIQLLEKQNENLRQNNQNANTDATTTNNVEIQSETAKSEAMDVESTDNLNGDAMLIPKTEIIEEDVTTANPMPYAADNESHVEANDLNSCAINDLSSLSSRQDVKAESTSYFNGSGSGSVVVESSVASTTTTDNIPQVASTTTSEEQAINTLKRPHEECSPTSENKVQVIQQQPQLAYVTTPRMLPPKKSKLRMTPEEMADQQEIFVAMPVAEEALSLVMEKDPLASSLNDGEDLSDGGGSGGMGGIGFAAQRILTRRRSMRQQTQPNGSINMTMVGGLNGSNDSTADTTTLN